MEEYSYLKTCQYAWRVSQFLEGLLRKGKEGGMLVKEIQVKRNEQPLKIILIFGNQVPITEFILLENKKKPHPPKLKTCE